MSLISELEEKFGLKVEKLRSDEKQALFSMINTVQDSQMSLDKLRDYLLGMRDAVEKELINEPEFLRIFIFKIENRKQIFLKARLQNYILLLNILISPEKAKSQLENMVESMVKHNPLT